MAKIFLSQREKESILFNGHIEVWKWTIITKGLAQHTKTWLFLLYYSLFYRCCLAFMLKVQLSPDYPGLNCETLLLAKWFLQIPLYLFSLNVKVLVKFVAIEFLTTSLIMENLSGTFWNPSTCFFFHHPHFFL